MQNVTTMTENKPAKKVWQKPDFYTLDRDTVNTGTHPAIFERSFTSNGMAFDTNAPKFAAWQNAGNYNGPTFYYS